MRKQLLAFCFAIGLALPSWGNVSAQIQNITINGQKVEKTATELSFDGDNVVLHFSDGSSQSADMGSVLIIFDTTTGIDNIHTFSLKNETDGILNLSGIAPGQRVQVYDVSGKIIAEAKASSDATSLDISNAKRGTYILRVGNDVVKFIKR